MIIKQESFLSILGMTGTRFSVPPFQRVYSWGQRNCQELWDDVMRAGTVGAGHFAGVVLFAPDPEGWGQVGRLNVIDGQQRTTTVTLMLLALRSYLREAAQEGEGSVAGVSAQRAAELAAQVDADYLHVAGVDEAPVRLQLSFLDGPTLEALVEGKELPQDHSGRLVENMQFFASCMRKPGFDVNVLWRGLQELQVISALLDGTDNPQLVFESLNARGKALSAADLLRNSLLFSLQAEERMRLYTEYWRPLEADLAARGISDGMEKLLRAWLASRYRDSYVKNESDVFAVLKRHLEGQVGGAHERLLRQLEAYGRRYASDAEFRKKEDKNAKDWLAGKSDGLVSKRKIFGD